MQYYPVVVRFPWQKNFDYRYNELYDESTVPVIEPNDIKVLLNGKEPVFDINPVIINDRTLVPVRAIAESLDCHVKWYQEAQVVENPLYYQ